MKVLVIGSGAREHCLAWKLAQSPEVERVYVAPGNGGTQTMPKGENVPISAGDASKLIDFALKNDIGLTVVGPEDPLVNGLATKFRRESLVIFGPGSLGAQLEGSKKFAKNFGRQYGIPTAEFTIFDDINAAEGFLQDIDRGMVIKASGLAAGKGVIVCCDKRENLEALDLIMHRRFFGDSGDTVVIEERLHGFEASLMVITDGKHYIKLPYSQDHKRQLDGDMGPNTGGMGAFCPTPRITAELDRRISEEILLPTLKGIVAEFGDDFRGVLYIGLMITDRGPMVLEFNVRFGDPEPQVVLPLCEMDLAEVLLQCTKGQLGENHVVASSDERCLGVVVASDGYPGNYARGVPCDFLDSIAGKHDFAVFHAGTKREDGRLVSSGGRVATVCSVGKSFNEVRGRIYKELASYDTEGFFYRKDLAAGLS